MWFVVCGLWFVVCGLWFVVCGVWGWGGVEGSVDVAGDVAFEAASDFSHSVYRQGCSLRTPPREMRMGLYQLVNRPSDTAPLCICLPGKVWFPGGQGVASQENFCGDEKPGERLVAGEVGGADDACVVAEGGY